MLKAEHWLKETAEGAEVETSEFLAALVRLQKPKLCLETGTAHGQTAEKIGKALLLNGFGVLHSCETEMDRVEASIERVKGLPVTVHHIQGIEFIRNWTGETFDFAFVDSWWNPVRMEEILELGTRMSPYGFLCLHDVCQNYGVTYDRFADQFGWMNLVFHTPYGLAVWQAPGPESWRFKYGGGGKMVELHEA